ncbi:peptidoglycan-binding protein [Roseovarius sp. SCSIO 43702]|uniref:peptidoglycan-binding domain-containing protein n=1 Tax=Roseovarius sp. SCSIO 43702 TaxID=2823043 RepID=UPI001C739DFB|nr:peptidoglycan-binding domain-containing protein [Roseovarius sp. SCSIO 43702]QYX56929.1 peptidoglycan-binding protein [Roseovarius sp. SCSIO 43702]
MSRPHYLALAAACLLAACGAATTSGTTEPFDTWADAPEGAEPGTCWGKVETPAVVETITEQIILQPAETLDDGTVLRPAAYRTETRQAIVEERKITWFEAVCADDLKPEFVASVQRALQVRGLYRGAITGQMDARTRAAIRKFQAPDGPDSGLLSVDAARQLGLVAVERPEDA